MKQTILIVGASGQVGSEIAKNLKSQGIIVRETTSKKESANKDKFFVNLLTGEGINEAFLGVDRAFLLSPAGYADQEIILKPLIAEAKKQKLQKVVLMTALGANASDQMPFRKAEIALETSGLNYNIVRPNWFSQNFHTFWIQDIKKQGKILLPAEESKTSFIDSRDIAAVAARLLVTDNFNNQSFDLTGPEAITHADVANAISEVTGQKISYESISPETFKKNVMALGLSNDYADLLNAIFSAMRMGYSSIVTDSVQKITGQKPRSVLEYVQDYKQRWK